MYKKKENLGDLEIGLSAECEMMNDDDEVVVVGSSWGWRRVERKRDRRRREELSKKDIWYTIEIDMQKKRKQI